jgi:hypothetical protein
VIRRIQFEFATKANSSVIAILLGKLGLSVDDPIDAFLQLCEAFSLGEELDPHLRSEKLVSATKVLLQRIGVSEEAKLCGDLNRGEGCKVYVFPPLLRQDKLMSRVQAQSPIWLPSI